MRKLETATSHAGTELTTDGIKLSSGSGLDLRDYRDVDHGKIVFENQEIVVYQDHAGYELNEWSDAFGVERAELSQRMHELAREHYDRDDTPSGGDPWSAYDPLVFVKTEADE